MLAIASRAFSSERQAERVGGDADAPGKSERTISVSCGVRFRNDFRSRCRSNLCFQFRLGFRFDFRFDFRSRFDFRVDFRVDFRCRLDFKIHFDFRFRVDFRQLRIQGGNRAMNVGSGA